MKATVTALLVSHDGARWLPAVLDGLTGQSRRPDRVVAVDTGSSDTGPDLLRERLGADAVHSAPARTSYGAAVAAGLRTLPPAGPDDTGDSEWVWLLHDDSAPAPRALEVLLDAAEQNPSVDVLGPKLREWPSLRRLLEVGVTISGTGRRETGLERGEYDQGQHDQIHEVLAVNTAGMLVRRSLLERLGFDERLPLFGNDIDFGWRAARAGHRTLTVPDAVVFHVEAAHRGVRSTELSGRHYRRGERQAALYTLLVNGSASGLPFRAVRLLLGSMIRALGFLLVRSPGEALDELGAVVRVYGRPFRIISGRRRRRATAQLSHREVRHLLAPPWLPYRHGLDFLSDLATAVAHQAGDMSAARRAARAEAADAGPVSAEAQNLPEDNGFLARVVTNPAAGGLLLLLVLALVSARGLVGSGMLSGGALLPAPGGAADWWRTYLASSHDLGTGSSAPAAPYLVPLAALGTLLLGKAWLVIDLLMLLAVPLAAFGGYRFLLRWTQSRPAALWGGAVYGLLPVLTGAVQEGRLGTVVAILVLPWLAHSALFLDPSESSDRRWRAAWRTTLWLALLAAFAPLGLLLAVLLTAAALVGGRVVDGATWSSRRTWLPVVTPVLAAPVLLLPWTISVWAHQGLSAWVFEAGLPAPRLADPLGWLDVAFGRPGGAGAPWWIGLGAVLAAVGALARPDTRRHVLRCWVVLALALVVTAALSGIAVAPAASDLPQQVWSGLPLVLAQAAGIAAAAAAGAGIRSQLTGKAFGWRQPVGAALVVLALLAPVAGLVWWAVAGSDDPLDRRPASVVPTYMSDAALDDPQHGILVVRGDRARGFDHLLLRGPGLRIGDESVLPTADEQRDLTALVGALVTAPDAEDVQRLASYGIGFVFAPAPVDGRLSGNLDTLSGVTTGSAFKGARAWQIQEPPASTSLSDDDSAARPWLLALQALAILVVAVQAAPTRKVSR